MRWTTLSLLAASLWACDLNEGPREETREAVEAARDGRSPEAVENQLDDVHPDAARGPDADDRIDGRVDVNDRAFERDLDRDLRKAEKWAKEVRRDLDSGARQVDEQFDRSFESIEQDLRAARADYDRLDDSPDADRQTLGESLREKVRQLSLRVDALDGEVDDKPGADPHGPG